MKFSLVLATLGRTRELERFLASLARQTYQDFELIVVDQNPDDMLGNLLDPYANKLSILHIRAPATKGASRARNAGLGYISGDVVAFPDDDCHYPPNLLDKVARFFATYPKIDGLTGRSIDEDGKTTGNRFDTKPGYLNRLNVWTRAIEYTTFLREKSVRELWFDEELGVGAGTAWGAGEGADYLLQLLSRKASLYYDPDLIVVHPPFLPPYDDRAIQKAHLYGSGMGYLLRQYKMPLRFKAKWLVRPLGGAILALVSLNRPLAKYRWATLKGRLKGLLS